MSVRRVNGTTPTISRRKSNPDNKKLIKVNPKSIQHQKTINKNSNILTKKRNLKVDYNSSNYLYNDDEEDYYEAYPYDKINYYEKTQNNSRYNNGVNDNYITVEHEDGHIKYIQKNYVEFKPIYKNKNIEYFEDENSENNYTGNENINFEDEYDPEIKSKQFPKLNNYYLTQNNSGVRKFKKNTNQNIVSQSENHQSNYKKDIKRNTRLPEDSLQNYGSNITTTNNTYNNNIYCISPINVKNKSKNKNQASNNKKSVRKSTHNLSKKNSISKNIDITLNSKTPNKERDYFRMNNITDKSLKEKYINSIILIQSVYRSYLVKIKLYNNISLYIHCKKVIEVLESLIVERQMSFWKLFKEYTSYKFYDDIIGSKINLNELKKLLDNKNSYSKEKPKVNSLHKELGDSFNIIINNTQKESTEKKLKSKLNDVIKENAELKNQLVDNKNIEEKMKNLMDENMKNKSINDIIIKDNQQLAKKLKDIQDYRKIRLIIENTQSIDLTQKQKIELEELVKTNDFYLNKLKKICLNKIIHNIMSHNKKLLKDKFNKYRKVVQKMKNDDYNKQMFLKTLFGKIRNNLKIKNQKYFLYLINNIKEINFKKQLQTKCLENVINNTSKNLQITLYKNYFKFFSQIMKCEAEENIKEAENINKEKTKEILLRKIFRKCCKDKKSSLKICFDKWYLKSVIISIREAARDKKKKRKLKRKTNKLLYQKQFGYTEKPPNYYKNNPEIIHIVSNGTLSLSNQAGDNTKKNKISTSSDKINKKNNIDEKNNRIIKKNNSINEIKNSDNKDDNKENINCNEDSDEDSGDSFGLDNPSDKE